MTTDLPPGLQDWIQHQHGAVSRHQLVSAEVSDDVARARVASGQWQRSAMPGVYVCYTGTFHRETELWSALLYVGRGAMLSHETAAETWGFAEAGSPTGPVHVTIPAERRVRAQPGVRLHRSREAPRKVHPARSLPVARVEETVLDIVDRAETFSQVVGWVTRACRGGRTRPDLLRAAMSERARLRWRRWLDTLLDDVASGVHSVLERVYLRHVERAHGLPRGSRQRHRAVSASAQWIDVAYEEFGLLVELDGRLGHEATGRFRDRRRDNVSTVRGFDTLRYGWEDTVERSCAVAGEVALILQRKGWREAPVPCGPGCTVADDRRAS